MNSRFEQLIVGAVAIGALTLAGCSSSGGGGGNGTDDGGGGGGGGSEPSESAVQFLGGRATSATEISLFFSEAITLPDDASAAAALFTVNGTNAYYGIASTSTSLCVAHGGSGQSLEHCTQFESYLVSVVAYSSFADGSAIGAITAATIDPEDSTRLRLTIDGSIIPGDSDDGTGAVRLAYTGGADGLLDEAGDFLADIAIPEGQTGNIGADFTNPVVVAARTISSTEVELTFNEPVSVDGDASAVLADFAVTSVCLRAIGTVESFFNFTGTNGYDFAHPTTFSAGMQSLFNDNSYYNGASIVVSTGAPNKVLLTVEAIPSGKNFQGFLGLNYLHSVEETGDLVNSDGGILQPLTHSNRRQPGPVRDTVGEPGDCVSLP